MSRLFNFHNFKPRSSRSFLQNHFRNKEDLKVSIKYEGEKEPLQGLINIKEFANTDYWFLLRDDVGREHLLNVEQVCHVMILS